MNAFELNQRLLQDVEGVIRHLLPSAKFDRNEASVGSIYGEAGESLKIHLTGAKAGYWADFSSEDRGKSLVSLWVASRASSDFTEGLRQIRDYLGIREDNNNKLVSLKKVKKPIKVHAAKTLDHGPVLDYLIKTRGLQEVTLKLFKVGQTKDKGAIAFPFLSPDGQHVEMVKYLKLDRKENKKEIWTEKDSSKVLFGKHQVRATGELFITEGEIDAMSMKQMCYQSVSVPFGAKWDNGASDPNQEWIENDWEWLEQFERVYLCMDNDEEGQKAAQSIAKRLGMERCYFVKMPEGCKDANDVLLKEMGADLHECIESASQIDPINLKNVADFAEGAWEVIEEKETAGIGTFLPIDFRIREGEVTLWTGINGHGKTEFVSYLAVHLASKGVKTCVASLEMPPPKTVRSLVLQSTGLGSMERSLFNTSINWLSSYFWLVDHIGSFKWKELAQVLIYARKRYNVTNFVIDSVMYLGIDDDNLQAQKEVAVDIANFAKFHGTHIHLIAHSRKKNDEEQAPGKMDIKGSGAWTDAAHNVLSVYRNVKKDEKLSELKADLQTREYERCLKEDFDGKITIYKQRETGELGWCKFWFDRKTRQFRPAATDKLKNYIE